MEINFDNFEDVVKRPAATFGNRSPGFYVTSTTLSIANVSNKEQYKFTNGNFVVKIQYNALDKMLRISPVTDPHEGYVFEEIGYLSTGLGRNSIPAPLKEMKVPRGFYKPVEEYHGVYIFAEEIAEYPEIGSGEKQHSVVEKTPEEKYAVEPSIFDIKVGDIVVWRYHQEGNSDNDMFVTGNVLEIYSKNGELYLKTEAITKRHRDITDRSSHVKAKNVIIREKRNV